MKNNIVESVLQLQELSFERLEFKRIGPKNYNEIEYRLSVQIGSDSDTGIYKTVLNLKANKKEEYEIALSVAFKEYLLKWEKDKTLSRTFAYSYM